jgi:hypothetical protein
MTHGAPASLLLIATFFVPEYSRAADGGKQQVARDLGAILAWRLGPEAVEERCRVEDPEGSETRRKSLLAWLDKNAALIKSVDERVAEVVPLAYPVRANVDAVQAVRTQVKTILLEELTAGKTPEQLKAICKAEANPASPRWNSNGMPHVAQSLAGLYDWKTSQDTRKP